MFGSKWIGVLRHPGYNKGGSTTSTQQLYSPEEAAQRALVMDEANRVYLANRDTLVGSAYPGAAPVGRSADTQASLDAARAYGAGPATQQAQNINNAVGFGLKDVLYPGSNPALQSTIDAAVRPITESYTDTGGVMSQIRDGGVDAGQFGSSRQGIAEGIAAGRYADAVGDVSSRVATEGYNQGLDTFAKTLAFAPEALQTGLVPSSILGGLGAEQESRAAEQENYDAASRYWELNAPWAPLQNYASLVYGGSDPATVSKSKQASDPVATASQIVGTAATAYLAYMAFAASDRRLKHTITTGARDAHTGLQLYDFS